MKDIKQMFETCVMLGDKGYLSVAYPLDLFTSNRMCLEVPMRTNQHHYKSYPPIFKKSRKQIEALFSPLCDPFMVRRNYAKTIEGFKTGILSKITTITTIQLINNLLTEILTI